MFWILRREKGDVISRAMENVCKLKQTGHGVGEMT